MRLSRRRALAVGVALVFGPASGAVADEDVPADDRPLRLGTSTPGGGFALYGETVERVVNGRAGRRAIEARPTRGSAENLVLLRRGALDAALVQGTTASEVFEQDDAGGLRILFAMYPSPGMLAVPGASPLRALLDVRGRRIVFGVRTSGLVTLGRQVFDGVGLDVDRDLTAIYTDEAARSPDIVAAGQADGLWGAGEGWPGFVRLASAPGGARFVGPTPAEVARIVERHPTLQAMTVPVGTYVGIDRPLATVGSVNWILVRADLDDARAARLVRALDEAAGALAAALPQAAFSTRANTLASAPSAALLHRVWRQA